MFIYKKQVLISSIVFFIIIFSFLFVNAQSAIPAIPLTDQQAQDMANRNTGGGLFGFTINVIGSFLGGAVASLVFVVSYIISLIAGAFIALQAFLITFVLQINAYILKSDFIQSGFSISLALANLFFVAMIIFVAIATILRRETYGIKAMLAKLIFMAVFINFGLTIAGSIIEVANNLSLYFIQSTNPGGKYADFNSFATAISGAFTPQRFFIFEMFRGEIQENLPGIQDKELAGLLGESLAKIIQPIIGLFFSIFILIIIIITFGALITMLLYRYVILGILLVLLPLAWICWVFPNLKRHWHEWWSNFFRWTFFAPLVLFFIYLCLLTLKGTVGGGSALGPAVEVNFGGMSFQYNPSNSNEVIAGLSRFAGSFVGNIIIPILNGIIMSACFMGGLFAANKLGIEGAKAAYQRAENIAKGAGKGISNWTKNRLKGYAASAMTQLTPPKYTGWRRIFNPVNRLTYGIGKQAGRVAERMGTSPKLEEISKKYGPEAILKKKEDKKRLRQEIENINKKIQNPEKIIQQRRQLEQELQQNIDNLKGELQKRSQPITNRIANLESMLEKEMDVNKISEIKKEISKAQDDLKTLQQEYEERIREVESKLESELKKFDAENSLEALISRRRSIYKEISELEPKGLLKSMIDSALGKEESRKKKQEEALKKLAEAFDLKFTEEEKREKTPSSPPKPSPKPQKNQ